MIRNTKKSSVKRYRQFAGYTQNDMAKYLNVGLSTYRQKEQGLHAFNMAEMVKVKELFQKRIGSVTIDAIFFGETLGG